MRISTYLAALAVAASLSLTSNAQAFTHIVQRGDTLAAIAERIYGRIQYEQILVAANALEAQGGIPIVPGMRLEIPAVSHRVVKKSDTWADLAKRLLGSSHRADVLAIANGTNPWLPPHEGEEIMVPYNLRYVATGRETIMSLARKFLGDVKKAWVLDHYNNLKGKTIRRGSVLLIPLTDLPLTDAGREAARASNSLLASQTAGATRASQRKVAQEIPALIADVRGGRYVDAIRRGNGFLAKGDLTKRQLATIHRQLLEAYVALGATGLGKAECDEWREHDASANIHSTALSPKLRAVCARGKR